MRIHEGVVQEIRTTREGMKSVWIRCPPEAIPAPGQYCMAWSPAKPDAPLAIPLYLAEAREDGFLTAAPVLAEWEPGDLLELRGPNGKGFQITPLTHRLALAALSYTADRLIPLIQLASQSETSVALFTSALIQDISSAVEIYPITELPGALDWADLLILDLMIDDLKRLRQLLNLKSADRLNCPAQALVVTNLPCGGMAECGACSVPGRRAAMLACLDGPVFDLKELDW